MPKKKIRIKVKEKEAPVFTKPLVQGGKKATGLVYEFGDLVETTRRRLRI